MSDQPERDDRGRLLPGHKGMGGRASRSSEEEMLLQFRKYFKNGHFKAILATLERQASKGNIKAIQIILEYTIGKPPQAIDVNLEFDNALYVTIDQ
jgi:hypothetical protein